MNRMKHIQLTLFCFLFVLFVSCNKDEYSPNLKGDILGSVFTFDEYGKLFTIHSGVKITAIGLNKKYQAISDYFGKYELKGVINGTYLIKYEKEGFGALIQYGIKHLGGEPTALFDFKSTSAVLLVQKSSIKIVDLKIENKTIRASFLFNTLFPPANVSLRVFYSTNPNFTQQTAQWANSLSVYNPSIGEYTGSWIINSTNPIPAGTKIYFKACAFAQPGDFTTMFDAYLYGISSYEDPISHQIIIPNLGDESAIYSFTVSE